nr:MAG TPA: hypothetical protein [Caudoviricetes sp.]
MISSCQADQKAKNPYRKYSKRAENNSSHNLLTLARVHPVYNFPKHFSIPSVGFAYHSIVSRLWFFQPMIFQRADSPQMLHICNSSQILHSFSIFQSGFFSIKLTQRFLKLPRRFRNFSINVSQNFHQISITFPSDAHKISIKVTQRFHRFSMVSP